MRAVNPVAHEERQEYAATGKSRQENGFRAITWRHADERAAVEARAKAEEAVKKEKAVEQIERAESNRVEQIEQVELRRSRGLSVEDSRRPRRQAHDAVVSGAML
jgi:hypothetical protein